MSSKSVIEIEGMKLEFVGCFVDVSFERKKEERRWWVDEKDISTESARNKDTAHTIANKPLSLCLSSLSCSNKRELQLIDAVKRRKEIQTGLSLTDSRDALTTDAILAKIFLFFSRTQRNGTE